MSGEQHPFLQILHARASQQANSWFQQKLPATNQENFSAAFAAAGRRLGESQVRLTDAEREALAVDNLALPEGWRLCDLGRSLLLMKASQATPLDQQPQWVDQHYKKGDNREKEAVLKTLAMLPEPERFLSTAVEACRSHVQSVFEAIACENAYPSRYFPDPAFNQLVLKAFFTGVRVERIVGLPGRRTFELSRMAHDYASERRAAGRAVPLDLNLVTLDEPPAEGSQRSPR